MTLEGFVALVNTVSYKPGYEIKAVMIRPDIYVLRIQCETWDSKNISKRTVITHEDAIPPEVVCRWFDVEAAKAFIYEQIMRAEIHELEEFLKFGGHQYRDPHGGFKRP